MPPRRHGRRLPNETSLHQTRGGSVATARERLEEDAEDTGSDVSGPVGRLAALVTKREREAEERTRIPRKLWILDEDFRREGARFGLEPAGRALGGLAPGQAWEVLTRALEYSEPAARGAVAVAGLRLQIPSLPPISTERPGHWAAAAARNQERARRAALASAITDDEAERFLQLAAQRAAVAVREDARRMLSRASVPD